MSIFQRLLSANFDGIHNPVARQLMRRALPPLVQNVLNVLLGLGLAAMVCSSCVLLAPAGTGGLLMLPLLVTWLQMLAFVGAGGMAFVGALVAATITAREERAEAADVLRTTTLPGPAYVEGYLLAAAYHARNYLGAARWLMAGFAIGPCAGVLPLGGIFFYGGGEFELVLIWIGGSLLAAAAMIGMLLLGLALGVAVGLLRWPLLGATGAAGGALLAVGAMMILGLALVATIMSDVGFDPTLSVLGAAFAVTLIPYVLYSALLRTATDAQQRRGW